MSLTPTMRLRFIERAECLVCSEMCADSRTYDTRTVKVLQQWWASDPDCYEDWVLQANGEWRDVPLEKP